VLVIGADHVTTAGGADAAFLLAIPALWLVGVILVVVYKYRSR